MAGGDAVVGRRHRIGRRHRHLHLPRRVLGVDLLDREAVRGQPYRHLAHVGARLGGRVEAVGGRGVHGPAVLGLGVPLELVGHPQLVACLGNARDLALEERSRADVPRLALLVDQIAGRPAPAVDAAREPIEVGQQPNVAGRLVPGRGGQDVLAGEVRQRLRRAHAVAGGRLGPGGGDRLGAGEARAVDERDRDQLDAAVEDVLLGHAVDPPGVPVSRTFPNGRR